MTSSLFSAYFKVMVAKLFQKRRLSRFEWLKWYVNIKMKRLKLIFNSQNPQLIYSMFNWLLN